MSHVVRKGETLKTVAKKYGVSVADLKTWNLVGKKGLRPGRRLVIYKPEKPLVAEVKKTETTTEASSVQAADNKQLADNTSTKPKIYSVKKGDTFYKIAQQFGMGVDDLLELNGLKKGAQLQVGKKLQVSK